MMHPLRMLEKCGGNRPHVPAALDPYLLQKKAAQ